MTIQTAAQSTALRKQADSAQHSSPPSAELQHVRHPSQRSQYAATDWRQGMEIISSRTLPHFTMTIWNSIHFPVPAIHKISYTNFYQSHIIDCPQRPNCAHNSIQKFLALFYDPACFTSTPFYAISISASWSSRVTLGIQRKACKPTHTHTHTHTYIYVLQAPRLIIRN